MCDCGNWCGSRGTSIRANSLTCVHDCGNWCGSRGTSIRANSLTCVTVETGAVLGERVFERIHSHV